MIQLTLINVLLDNKRAVEKSLTEEAWTELEEVGLAEAIQKYMNGAYNRNRCAREITKILGHQNKDLKNLMAIYKSMQAETQKFDRLTVTIPSNLSVSLNSLKDFGGKKSQFVSACIDNVLSKIGDDPKDMINYVNTWLNTEKSIDVTVPQSVLETREKKASIDDAGKDRKERRDKLNQLEQEELDRMQSKAEREIFQKQQIYINQRMAKVKKENGRKPTREEYVALMKDVGEKFPEIQEDNKIPTTSNDIELARKKQEYLNKKLQEQEEKKKKKKGENKDEDERTNDGRLQEDDW